MTKYRKVSDGHFDFLEYLKEYKLFGFIPRKKWCKVWRPYYDTFWGRTLDIGGYNNLVNSYHTNLESFVKKWTNIEDYSTYAEKIQRDLEKKAFERRKEIENKKGKIENL